MNYRLTLTAAVACLATSTALVPLIQGGEWFWAGLGAIVFVAAAGAATRQRALRALPPALCLLIALVVLLLYLNVVFAARLSIIRFIPTPRSMDQLWQLARTGLHDTQALAQPVSPFPGILFLAAAGIGLVAAITDLIAVRLRRCALAGLPLLVLFSVPIASGAGHNALLTGVLFCIGMAGYLSLLGADGRERLRLWGRLVTPWHIAADGTGDDDTGAGPRTTALAASGRRIGLAAVVLAIFTPLVIPGLTPHKLFPGHGSGSGSGLGGGSGNGSLDPTVQLTQDLHESKPTEVLTYHTTSTVPQYLQVYALNQLDTGGWDLQSGLIERNDPVSASTNLPPVPGLNYGGWGTTITQVKVDKGVQSMNTFLPLPYPARRVDPPSGGWVVDEGTLMVYTTTGTTMSGANYAVSSLNIDPDAAQLDVQPNYPKDLQGDLYVPPTYESLASFAHQLVKNAQTPYEEAVKLQNWFTSPGHFTYSLDVSGTSTSADALSNFLFHSKRGYCQQFAFAMATLARLLGIPARVAVGYTQGTPAGSGTYVVKTSDAHAWPELYFTGLGWLPWEPTPTGTALGQRTAVPPAYTTGVGTGSSQTGNNLPPNLSGPRGHNGSQGNTNQRAHFRSPAGTNLNGDRLAGKAADQSGLTQRVTAHHASTLPLALIVLAALVAAGLVAPRLTRSVVSRRRWMTAGGDAGRAHAAWSEFLDTLTDYGFRYGPGETPRGMAKRVTAQLQMPESARQSLRHLAELEERASYAPQPGPSDGLNNDLAVARAAVAAAAGRAARWRAVLLPVSAVTRLRQILAHGLDVFGWVEVAIARLAGRVPRPRRSES